MGLILSEFLAPLNAKHILTRMPATSIKKKPASVQAARNTLRRRGWTQAAVAQRLGVSAIHLNYVLNGRRESRRILHAIEQLPDNPSPA